MQVHELPKFRAQRLQHKKSDEENKIAQKSLTGPARWAPVKATLLRRASATRHDSEHDVADVEGIACRRFELREA
jgi:hypothetical protein